MPGLFGILSLDHEEKISADHASDVLDRMAEKLHHHPDYQQDRWTDPDGRLALGRIGHPNLIIAKEQVQSRGVEDFSLWRYGVVKAGASDGPEVRTDPLAHLASESGYFSAVILDSSRNQVLLFVDRRASEPLYYAQDGRFLYFAPEVKAILGLVQNPGELDPGSLASFLTAGYLAPHQTLFTGIRKIPSCHGLFVGPGGVRLQEYWQYIPGQVKSEKNEDELAEQLHHLVTRQIQDNFGVPEESVVFLSGGLDSRYILASVCEKKGVTPDNVHAVTWGESRGVRGSDPEISEQVVKALGVNHQFLKRRSDNYQTWFREANYLVDGLSEIAAFHPYEYQIMKALREDGFKQVVRGDEAFGYLGSRYSLESALVTVNIRPLDAVPHFAKVVERAWYQKAREASHEEYEALANRFRGLDYTTLKDVAYFTQRVPTYLSQAGYYKQVLFDQRNPLLSNELLDFYQMVPNSLRLHKKLFFRSFARAFPDLASIPYADSGSLEDWGRILTENTPLRQFMQEQFSDTKSGIWEVFDRESVLRVFESLGKSNPPTQSRRTSRMKAKIRQAVGGLFPAQLDRARAKRSLPRVPESKTLLRILVLKNWHDRFVSNL